MTAMEIAERTLGELPKPVTDSIAVSAVQAALKDAGYGLEAKQFANWFQSAGAAVLERLNA